MRMASKIAAAFMVLALAACNSSKDGDDVKGDPIAAVKAPVGKAWTDVVSVTELGGYKMGNPEAKLQLLEYGAISCPACAKFSVESSEEIKKMVETGTVAMEFRPFLIHGIQDIPGFLLAKCNGPESFFGLAEQLYATQNEWLGRLQTVDQAEYQAKMQASPSEQISYLADKMGLIDFVKQRGVPEDKARTCLADQKTTDAMVKLTEYGGNEDKVNSTPTLMLNGNNLNTGSWNEVKTKLRQAGAR